jgi:hypothetical protein
MCPGRWILPSRPMSIVHACAEGWFLDHEAALSIHVAGRRFACRKGEFNIERPYFEPSSSLDAATATSRQLDPPNIVDNNDEVSSFGMILNDCDLCHDLISSLLHELIIF